MYYSGLWHYITAMRVPGRGSYYKADINTDREDGMGKPGPWKAAPSSELISSARPQLLNFLPTGSVPANS